MVLRLKAEDAVGGRGGLAVRVRIEVEVRMEMRVKVQFEMGV